MKLMGLAVHLGTTFTQRICCFFFLQLLSIAWDDHLSVKYLGVEAQLEFRALLFCALCEFSVCLSVKLRVEGQLEFLGALLSVLVNFEAEETLQF